MKLQSIILTAVLYFNWISLTYILFLNWNVINFDLIFFKVKFLNIDFLAWHIYITKSTCIKFL